MLIVKCFLIYFCSFYLLVDPYYSFGIDPKLILKKSYKKCQSIQQGYFEMTKDMRLIMTYDTTTFYISGYFRKIPTDTLFSCAFHYKIFSQGEFIREVIYTGADLLLSSIEDSTVQIIQKSKSKERIRSFYRENAFLYYPLTTKRSYPFMLDNGHFDPTYDFEFICEEEINNTQCYHIKVNLDPNSVKGTGVKVIKIEFNYWIGKIDLVPIQFTNDTYAMINGDTTIQFEKFTLKKYEINNLINDTILTFKAIPSFYKTK